ncbi:shikimate dehydrogenase [Streptococcus pantholopis]|uniref:Shikimate dehydrogenase (NADP(+)) n=1 Tax=Streptococcus pantholopis TaxID=1811193 RepID=A0A172Q6Q4_9STRE|nr:shikimate dehydrogenase [Streptococcus pantholopis]AND79169.1 shikimate dehydrogenase [Streptococcus pantholopis]
MQIDGHTRLAAVVASPIKHSISPFIHNYAFAQLGINGVYVAWDTRPEDLEETVKNIRRYNMWGINLSMPYKRVVTPYLDELDVSASLFGMVNTVVNRDGKLIGYNTDGYGFFASLPSDFTIKGTTLTVLGGSGAATAISAYAARHGVAKINMFNKEKYLEVTRQRQGKVTEVTGVPVAVFDLADQALIQQKINEADLVVNANGVGMDGITMVVLPETRFKQGQLVADVIYNPFETPFIKLAKSQGIETINGLGMLLHQAAETFRLWTGQEMPVIEIWDELLKKYAIK